MFTPGQMTLYRHRKIIVIQKCDNIAKKVKGNATMFVM